MIDCCPYCGLPTVPSVSTHIAYTEVCLDVQIAAVLFGGGSDSEPTPEEQR